MYNFSTISNEELEKIINSNEKLRQMNSEFADEIIRLGKAIANERAFSEGLIDTLRNENERLRDALMKISTTFPSGPCCILYATYFDDSQHASTCHRGIAKQALNPEG